MLASAIRERRRERDILLMTHIVVGYPSFDASLRVVEHWGQTGHQASPGRFGIDSRLGSAAPNRNHLRPEIDCEIDRSLVVSHTLLSTGSIDRNQRRSVFAEPIERVSRSRLDRRLQLMGVEELANLQKGLPVDREWIQVRGTEGQADR